MNISNISTKKALICPFLTLVLVETNGHTTKQPSNQLTDNAAVVSLDGFYDHVP